MIGRIRIRKKQIQRAGWSIQDESPDPAGGYRMDLLNPSGERITIHASSRTRCYFHALRAVRERGEVYLRGSEEREAA